jgi:hypothetical protein
VRFGLFMPPEMSCNSAQWAPEPSEMSCNSTQWAPEPSEMVHNSAQWAPEPSEMSCNSAQWAPEPSEMSCNSAQWAPEPSEMVHNSAQWAPGPSEVSRTGVRCISEVWDIAFVRGAAWGDGGITECKWPFQASGCVLVLKSTPLSHAPEKRVFRSSFLLNATDTPVQI